MMRSKEYTPVTTKYKVPVTKGTPEPFTLETWNPPFANACSSLTFELFNIRLPSGGHPTH